MPGPADRAAERDEHRAGLALTAELAEPVRAVTRDERDVGQRLDVLDERRAPAHASFIGPRRHEGRLGGPAVQPLHEGGLLAGHEAVGRRDELESRLAAGAGALGDRAGEAPVRARRAAVDRDHDRACTDARCRRRGAVEHEVRVDPHQQAVLVACGLALDAVRDHDGRTPGRHGRQLEVRREAGAATASQAARLDRRDERAALATQARAGGRSARCEHPAMRRPPQAGAGAGALPRVAWVAPRRSWRDPHAGRREVLGGRRGRRQQAQGDGCPEDRDAGGVDGEHPDARPNPCRFPRRARARRARRGTRGSAARARCAARGAAAAGW